MNSPHPKAPGRPSWLTNDEVHRSTSPFAPRRGSFAALLRTSSYGSLNNLQRRSSVDDEEQAGQRHDEDIGKLLKDERRMSQILKGGQSRSLGLIGRSNPRYRWENYWKRSGELKAMSKPL